MPTAIQDISAANVQLADLIQQVENGNEIVLTRNGFRVARLIPERAPVDIKAQRRALIERLQNSVAGKITPGPDAAHSQDFLYDENGLPG